MKNKETNAVRQTLVLGSSQGCPMDRPVAGAVAEEGAGAWVESPWKLSGLRAAVRRVSYRSVPAACSPSPHLRGVRHPIGLVSLWRGRGAPAFPLCPGRSRGDNGKACGGPPKWSQS